MTSEDALKIRQERRARVRRIRGRVVGYSVGLFIVVWGVIAVVLVTGHDPALSRTTSSTTPATTSTGSASESTSGDSGASTGVSSSDSAGSSSSGSSNSTGAGSSTGSGSVSPVTSSQS